MQKILIANRGEIAVRIARACRDLGLASVAVYSDADRGALHVRFADQAVHIGPSAPAESYLRIDRLVEAARASGADAVHPGYGFLSENAAFAQACEDAGLTFIGPSAAAIALMGDKAAARRTARAAGVPVVAGSEAPFGPEASLDAIAAAAGTIGFPLAVKAVAGGGGKGLRVVERAADLASAVTAARSEAHAAFGDGGVYLERWVDRPRHVEVQLLADRHGTVVPFVERECSVQRRHQKVIEESPSPAVSPRLRAALASAAAAVATAARYTNAGTVEFLVDADGAFYFLEMNARLQVEHPITELVTGVDLVAWQIRLARGDALDLEPAAALAARGHAIECRVYAEDPDEGFLPSPGRITRLRMPAGPGVREDSSVEAGAEITVHYDPLIAKVSAWGVDRAQAIRRMARAMRELDVGGVRTSAPFFRWILDAPAFLDAAVHTGYLDALLHDRRGTPFAEIGPSHEEVAAIAAALHAQLQTRRLDAVPAGAPAAGRECGWARGAGSWGMADARGWRRAARAEAIGA